MHDLRRRWDLGSLCRALLTRGLAALGHSLKHVLGAIFSKIFGPLASNQIEINIKVRNIMGKNLGLNGSCSNSPEGSPLCWLHLRDAGFRLWELLLLVTHLRPHTEFFAFEMCDDPCLGFALRSLGARGSPENGQRHASGFPDSYLVDEESPWSRWNFHYITILRDPVSRYLSEWRHVQRGATWKASLHVCDGRPPTSEELPSCYTGDDWSGCPLKEFMDCPYNLANNRQVRMLSDLTLVGCYNLSVMPEKQRNKVLLESAKSNLKHMAFFGLTEFQRKTQYLFEKTFNMNFISPFTQYNTTRASSVEINEEIQKRIEGLNFLDMELYSYAKDLFLQRYQFMRQKEHQEARRKRQEQRKFLKGRFLQTHFQSQSQGQSQNPSQNPSQTPNLNADQNVTQNLIPNLTQSSGQNPSPKENRESQKQNPGQEQSDGNTSNGTHDYIGSVEKWR
eukprot:bmy_03710T0